MKFPNILEAIGNTPLVRINSLFKQHPFEVWAKCEFLNPGGSVKDRIGWRMVLDAEKAGKIKPNAGYTLIEPTSGNTGIGIALAGAVRGYRVVITLPEKMSAEKQNTLEALGAEIIRTKTEEAWDSPNSHIGIAKKLKELIPQSVILDQYANPSNPIAHEEGTAQEIIRDLGQVPDVTLLSAGTGGTITGIARAFKKQSPKAKIIGIDPVGSILAGDEPIKTYFVEGIGYDFIPNVLDRSLVDQWVKTTDLPSFKYSRRAIREEGFLCGGSSGSVLCAVDEVASSIPKGSKVVVLLADGIRNYMTKFVSPHWLDQNKFSDAVGEKKTLARDVLARS